MDKRIVIVEFSTADGQLKRLEGIECKFNVQKLMCAIMNKAQISIANLAKDDINYLTTYTSQFIAVGQHKTIKIYAGYEKTGVSQIFAGDIVRAIPTMPPDIWLNCDALSGYYLNKTPISKTISGDVPIQSVCEQTSNILGLSLNFEATIEKSISGFNFTGDQNKLIKSLNELGGITAYEDDGVLNVVNTGMPSNATGMRYINETSGMIGNPNPDPLGVEITVLLDNSLKIGQKIYLESISEPSCNGEYFIYELNHTGDLRGHDFYTRIKARRYRNGITGS